jgi:hypothetical protein
MKRLLVSVAMLVLSCLWSHPAHATDLLPWNNHAAPFNLPFGNDFDTHQQSRQLHEGGLYGFLYIGFTDIVTKDGYRVATHVNCNTAHCTVGWIMDGRRRAATFLYQAPSDHPVFLISRSHIPEPGAFAHFHWLGPELIPNELEKGYLLQLTAVDTFCFVHDISGNPGKKSTCRDLDGVVVKPGIDIATHLNIVTSVPDAQPAKSK